MSFKDEHEDEQPKKILISDSRHSRANDQAAEPEPAEVVPAAEVVEPVAVEAPPAPVPEPAPPVAEPKLIPAPDSQTPPEAPAPEEPEMTPAQQAEMEQLKLIFGAGLKGYLGGQLGILINFALINLGRSPNPATGLVAADPENARLAIDILGLIVEGVKSEFPPEETANITNIVNELKFTYMQTMTNEAPPPVPEPPAGG